jgi:membrane-associated phospholipid phosphatase
MNTNFNSIRETNFWSSIRSTPYMFFAYGLLNLIINPNYINILFVIAYSISFIINGILKYSTKQLYSYLDTDYIYPFGQGSRPTGATNCGTFLKVSNPNAISFGMPSGHSQLAWFFTTYYILHIINNKLQYINNNKYKYLSSLLLVILAVIVSYSRVYIDKCHTIGQVIIGGIIGIILGFILYNINCYILNKL